MKTIKQTLCKSCSNLVVIKFKDGKKERKKNRCFYNFTVSTYQNGNYYDENIHCFFIKECSFFNRPITFIPTLKKKDSDDSADSNRSNEVIDPMNFTDLKCREVLREEGRK